MGVTIAREFGFVAFGGLPQKRSGNARKQGCGQMPKAPPWRCSAGRLALQRRLIGRGIRHQRLGEIRIPLNPNQPGASLAQGRGFQS